MHFQQIRVIEPNNRKRYPITRCVAYFGKVRRLSPDVGRYFANCHEKDKNENSIRFDLLKQSDQRMDQDGLNTLNYQVINVSKNKMFTLFNVHY